MAVFDADGIGEKFPGSATYFQDIGGSIEVESVGKLVEKGVHAGISVVAVGGCKVVPLGL